MESTGTQTNEADVDGHIASVQDGGKDVGKHDEIDGDGDSLPVSNGDVEIVTPDVQRFVEAVDDVDDDDDNPQCGWFGIRPRFIQV